MWGNKLPRSSEAEHWRLPELPRVALLLDHLVRRWFVRAGVSLPLPTA
jgi:hypothetical protein